MYLKLCTNTTPGLRSTAQAGTNTCSRCCSGDLCNAEGCGEQGILYLFLQQNALIV